jgi:cytochrome c peroxidase
MRATGRRLGNPVAEQAQGPPTNPVEMGLPDIACAVHRASARPYRAGSRASRSPPARGPGMTGYIIEMIRIKETPY